MREYIAAIIMIAFTSLSFWGMNEFGFQNNPHDILWAIGAGLAILTIILLYTFLFVKKHRGPGKKKISFF